MRIPRASASPASGVRGVAFTRSMASPHHLTSTWRTITGYHSAYGLVLDIGTAFLALQSTFESAPPTRSAVLVFMALAAALSAALRMQRRYLSPKDAMELSRSVFVAAFAAGIAIFHLISQDGAKVLSWNAASLLCVVAGGAGVAIAQYWSMSSMADLVDAGGDALHSAEAAMGSIQALMWAASTESKAIRAMFEHISVRERAKLAAVTLSDKAGMQARRVADALVLAHDRAVWAAGHWPGSSRLHIAAALLEMSVADIILTRTVGGRKRIPGSIHKVMRHLRHAHMSSSWLDVSVHCAVLRLALHVRDLLKSSGRGSEQGSGGPSVAPSTHMGLVSDRGSVMTLDTSTSAPHGGAASTAAPSVATHSSSQQVAHEVQAVLRASTNPLVRQQFKEVLQDASAAQADALSSQLQVWTLLSETSVASESVLSRAHAMIHASHKADMLFSSALDILPDNPAALRQYAMYLRHVVGAAMMADQLQLRADRIETVQGLQDHMIGLRTAVLGSTQVAIGATVVSDDDATLLMSIDGASQGVITDVSKATTHMFGRHAMDLIGARVTTIFPPLLGQSMFDSIQDSVAQGAPVQPDIPIYSAFRWRVPQLWLGWHTVGQYLVPLVCMAQESVNAKADSLQELTASHIHFLLRPVRSTAGLLLCKAKVKNEEALRNGSAATLPFDIGTRAPSGTTAPKVVKWADLTVTGTCAGLLAKLGVSSAALAAGNVQLLRDLIIPREGLARYQSAKAAGGERDAAGTGVHLSCNLMETRSLRTALHRSAGSPAGMGGLATAVECGLLQEEDAGGPVMVRLTVQALPFLHDSSGLVDKFLVVVEEIEDEEAKVDTVAAAPSTPPPSRADERRLSFQGIAVSEPTDMELEGKRQPVSGTKPRALPAPAAAQRLAPRQDSKGMPSIMRQWAHVLRNILLHPTHSLARRTRQEATSMTSKYSNPHANTMKWLLWVVGVLVVACLVLLASWWLPQGFDDAQRMSSSLQAAGLRTHSTRWVASALERIRLRQQGTELEAATESERELQFLLRTMDDASSVLAANAGLSRAAVDAVVASKGIDKADVLATRPSPANSSTAAALEEFFSFLVDGGDLKYDTQRLVPVLSDSGAVFYRSIFEAGEWGVQITRTVTEEPSSTPIDTLPQTPQIEMNFRPVMVPAFRRSLHFKSEALVVAAQSFLTLIDFLYAGVVAGFTLFMSFGLLYSLQRFAAEYYAPIRLMAQLSRRHARAQAEVVQNKISDIRRVDVRVEMVDEWLLQQASSNAAMGDIGSDSTSDSDGGHTSVPPGQHAEPLEVAKQHSFADEMSLSMTSDAGGMSSARRNVPTLPSSPLAVDDTLPSLQDDSHTTRGSPQGTPREHTLPATTRLSGQPPRPTPLSGARTGAARGVSKHVLDSKQGTYPTVVTIGGHAYKAGPGGKSEPRPSPKALSPPISRMLTQDSRFGSSITGDTDMSPMRTLSEQGMQRDFSSTLQGVDPSPTAGKSQLSPGRHPHRRRSNGHSREPPPTWRNCWKPRRRSRARGVDACCSGVVLRALLMGMLPTIVLLLVTQTASSQLATSGFRAEEIATRRMVQVDDITQALADYTSLLVNGAAFTFTPDMPREAQTLADFCTETVSSLVHGSTVRGVQVPPLDTDSEEFGLLLNNACVKDPVFQVNCTTAFDSIPSTGGIIQSLLRVFSLGDSVLADLQALHAAQGNGTALVRAGDAATAGTLFKLRQINALDRTILRDALLETNRANKARADATVDDVLAGLAACMAAGCLLLILDVWAIWLYSDRLVGDLVAARTLVLLIPEYVFSKSARAAEAAKRIIKAHVRHAEGVRS